MHSLQELHHEKLQTLGTTFLFSVRFKREGKKRIIMFYLWTGLQVCLVSFQEPWYTFTSLTRVILRGALAEKKIL